MKSRVSGVAINRLRYWVFAAAVITAAWPVFARSSAMVAIPAGSFRPFDLKKDAQPVAVLRFELDAYPVTVAAFAGFLESHSEWKKNNAPAIKADVGYLKDVDFTRDASHTAVTNISWYAARAYCRAQGKRLPTLDEWEYAATYNGWDRQPATNGKILGWFGEPASGKAARIGTGLVSPQGVHDLHGLIWEWVEDFNASTVTGDSRADTQKESNLFCGATALSGSDLRNYATYMRYGMRSSLRGSYTGRNLGFRCARGTR